MSEDHQSGNKRAWTIAIIILVIVFGGTFAFDIFKRHMIKQYFAKFRPPPVTISTTKAVLKTWHPKLTAVGSLIAVNGVNVSPEVSGQVVKIFFKSGQTVKKGDPLIQLDDAVDRQLLNNDMAQLTLNKVNYSRQMKLYRQSATSKSAVDNAKAKLDQLLATVKSDEVKIAKKLIKAPFAGKLGIRKVNIGQYIKPGEKLVTLQSLDPLFVDFTLPEQDLSLLRVGQKLEIEADGFPAKIFYGQITAINSLVDVGTRTVEVRGALPNKLGRLTPGLFVDVDVILPARESVLTVPQTAVTFSLYGNSIYVVQQKGKDKKGKLIVDKNGKPVLVAIQKFVTIGARHHTLIEVKKGIKAGETVVTSGQLKLHTGVIVLINNSVKLD